MDNANSPEYLEKIKTQVFENLRRTAAAPSVQMTEVPRTPLFAVDNTNDPDNEGEGEDLDEREQRLDDEDNDQNPDTRYTERKWDARIEHEGELDDSDDEDMNEQNGVKQQPGKKRMNIMDYKNPHADPGLGDLDSGDQTPAESAPGSQADDEMPLDDVPPPPTSNALPATDATNAANAAVAREIMQNKASETPQPPQPTQGEETASNAPARPETSPPPEVKADGDIEMGNASDEQPLANAPNSTTQAGGAQVPQTTPPPDVEMGDSGATTASGASADTAAEVEAAKEEGIGEREKEDVKAEKARESEAAGGVV